MAARRPAVGRHPRVAHAADLSACHVHAAEKAVLAELGWAPFKVSDNNQVLPIRQMEINRSILKVKGDEKLSEADKQTQLASLQKKFDEIGAELAALKK